MDPGKITSVLEKAIKRGRFSQEIDSVTLLGTVPVI
jgi:hypothetical protein